MTIRVGVVGPAAEDDFAANILAGFEDLGMNAVSLGQPTPQVPGRRMKAILHTLLREPSLGPLIERDIVRRARKNQVNLVVTVVSLTPTTVRALQASGARVALWFPDHVANLGALWMFSAPYDGLFFKEPALVRHLNAILDLPIHYLPEACNPRIHRPVESATAAGRVVVVGNLHPIRARLLERLACDGVPLAIYGPSYQAGLHVALQPFHVGRYVRGLEKSAIFSSAAAVLNSLHPAEIEGMNCRLFEATAASGSVVTEHRHALDGLFTVGADLLAYRSYDELVTNLRSLLNDYAFGRRLGAAASRRSLAEHSYTERLTTLLDLMPGN